MSGVCPSCKQTFVCLGKHWAKKSSCRPSKPAKAEVVEQPSAEVDPLVYQHHQSVARAQVAEVLQHLRCDKLAPDNLIDELKPALRRVKSLEDEYLYEQLVAIIQPGKEAELQSILASVADPFYGLGTRKLEQAYATKEQKLPYLNPRVRNLQRPGADIGSKDLKKHGSVNFSVVDTIGRIMQNDAELCAAIIAESDRWKLGELFEKEAEVFADAIDGKNTRFHPHLLRKATAEEADVVRVGIKLYNDGVTVYRTPPPTYAAHPGRPSAYAAPWPPHLLTRHVYVTRSKVANPLGYAKGEQKYECCYYSIVNLPSRLRNQMDAIQVIELTNSKAFKKYGGARVLSGVKQDGEQVVEPNFAADMRRLAEGVPLEIPKEDGGTRTIRLQAYVVGLSADFPAAGALLPAMESTSAHLWCRECDLDQR